METIIRVIIMCISGGLLGAAIYFIGQLIKFKKRKLSKDDENTIAFLRSGLPDHLTATKGPVIQVKANEFEGEKISGYLQTEGVEVDESKVIMEKRQG